MIVYIQRLLAACLFVVFSSSLMAQPVEVTSSPVLSSTRAKVTAGGFSQKGKTNGQSKPSSRNTSSSSKKKNRKFRKYKNKRAPKKEKKEDFYDITLDENVCVAEEKAFPEPSLLVAREAIGNRIHEVHFEQPNDIDHFVDELYEFHYDGMGWVNYSGVVGDFLETFRLALDVLSLTPSLLDEESVSWTAYRRFVSAVKALRVQIAECKNLRLDTVLFRLEALEAHLIDIGLTGVLDFRGVLGVVHNLNRLFVEYLRQVLGANPAVEPEPVIEEVEEGITTEAYYYLPTELLDFDDGFEPLARDSFDYDSFLLLDAFRVGIPGIAGCLL